MEKTTEENTMRQAHLAVLICGVGIVGVAWGLSGGKLALSAAVGAGVAAVNLFVLSRAVANLIQGQRSSWAGIAVIKFVLLFAVTYGLIQSGLVEALGLAAGFASLPLGILLAGILAPHPPLPVGTPGSAPETDHA